MNLSTLKSILPNLDMVTFQLENGNFVPEHFHITEVGMVTKNFIDCGGTLREEKVVNLQLWSANDLEHRLIPAKLLNIIHLSEEKLKLGDFEIEVEYQTETIGKYGLSFNGKHFVLSNKQTACLAMDECGTPQKEKVNLAQLQTTTAGCCALKSGCC